MVDPRVERQAYFASLATPDLIVCATVERTAFSSGDLEIIRAELIRRGVDPTRLAQPGQAETGPLWPTIQHYAGPLPRTADWWKEGWQLFRRHLSFLALLALVIFIPEYILRHTVRIPGSGGISFNLLADTFLAIAFQALFAGAVIQALCRFLKAGHCSVGRAVGIGIEHWSWMFTNMFKALAIAFGIPYLLIALGAATDEGGLVAIGIILIIYPGTYLGLRYIWVQPIAALDPHSPNPLIQSKLWAANNYGRLFKFVLFGLLIIGLCAICTAIVTAILPGELFDSLVEEYIRALFTCYYLTTLLVGYIHMRHERQTASVTPGPASETADPLPPPPPLQT